jgi:hypothetical protein
LPLDFLEMVPKKRFFQNYPPSPQWNPDAILKLPGRPGWNIWKPGENLVKTISKTWWKIEENLGEFPIPGEFPKLGENLVSSKSFHQKNNGTKKRFTPPKFSKKRVLLFFAFYGDVWVEFGEVPKPGENLLKTWWISKTTLVNFRYLVLWNFLVS